MTDKGMGGRRVKSAPGQPKVGSAAHKDWIAYCKKHGLRSTGHAVSVYAATRHPEVARRLVALGANDWEIAQAFGVDPITIMKWKTKHPEFAEAMRYRDEDGTFQNDRVKRSLLHRATGYNFHSEKVFVNDGRVTRVPVVEHVPPSENAARFWLQNRDAKNWNAALNLNLRAQTDLDVTITRDTSPQDAMAAFIKLLHAPASALIERDRASSPLVDRARGGSGRGKGAGNPKDGPTS
jgi:hypothetical protein